MNIDYVTYLPSGEITGYGTCLPEVLSLQVVREGESIMVGKGTFRDYVLDGQIVTRPWNTTKLVGMQLQDVPNPSVITIEGINYDCTDGTVDLSFDVPGLYTVMVSSFPYMAVAFQVTQE
jgi:hypothetical protein